MSNVFSNKMLSFLLHASIESFTELLDDQEIQSDWTKLHNPVLGAPVVIGVAAEEGDEEPPKDAKLWSMQERVYVNRTNLGGPFTIVTSL